MIDTNTGAKILNFSIKWFQIPQKLSFLLKKSTISIDCGYYILKYEAF